MFFFVAILVSKFFRADSRVLCGGLHTSSWVALGYACPINCNNIVKAIDKLRLYDYEYLLRDSKKYKKTIKKSVVPLEKHLEIHLDDIKNANSTRTRKFNLIDKSDEYKSSVRHLITEFSNTFKNPKAQQELRPYLKKVNKNVKCSKFDKGGVINKKMVGQLSKKCARRYNSIEEYLYKIITDILNRHTGTMKFTINMTKILLRKLFGDSTDLRNGFLDVGVILQYLREVLSSLAPRDEKPTVKLRTKHCFNLFVPGCFCKEGFVEKSGICVYPQNCTMDAIQMTYLSRVFVT